MLAVVNRSIVETVIWKLPQRFNCRSRAERRLRNFVAVCAEYLQENYMLPPLREAIEITTLGSPRRSFFLRGPLNDLPELVRAVKSETTLVINVRRTD